MRTERFARGTALAGWTQATARTHVVALSARVWHLVNLPAGTDVARLRAQIGALDREVRRLALRLEQQAHNDGRTDGRRRTVSALDPHSVLERVRRHIERNALRARNGIRLATARPSVGCTSKDVVWRRGRTELWHYRNDDVRVTPPLLIVFSLISRSYILDLSPGNSFIERLLKAGFDVWLLDWGVPDERDAQNRLEDYVDEYLPAGIARLLELTGCDEVSLLGYCFGGDLALLHAADGNVPPQVVLQGFRTLKPTAQATRYVDLWERNGCGMTITLLPTRR